MREMSFLSLLVQAQWKK